MENKTDQSHTINRLVPEKIRTFFVSHLNHIYCAKSHFVERLPAIGLRDHFANLKIPIELLTADVTEQILKLSVIFKLLDAEPTVKKSGSLINAVEEAFTAIHLHENEPEMQKISLYYYLYNIANMEMASFKVLKIAAVGLKNNPISLLVKLNFKDAKSDRAKILFAT